MQMLQAPPRPGIRDTRGGSLPQVTLMQLKWANLRGDRASQGHGRVQVSLLQRELSYASLLHTGDRAQLPGQGVSAGRLTGTERAACPLLCLTPQGSGLVCHVPNSESQDCKAQCGVCFLYELEAQIKYPGLTSAPAGLVLVTAPDEIGALRGPHCADLDFAFLLQFRSSPGDHTTC